MLSPRWQLCHGSVWRACKLSVFSLCCYTVSLFVAECLSLCCYISSFTHYRCWFDGIHSRVFPPSAATSLVLLLWHGAGLAVAGCFLLCCYTALVYLLDCTWVFPLNCHIDSLCDNVGCLWLLHGSFSAQRKAMTDALHALALNDSDRRCFAEAGLPLSGTPACSPLPGPKRCWHAQDNAPVARKTQRGIEP